MRVPQPRAIVALALLGPTAYLAACSPATEAPASAASAEARPATRVIAVTPERATIRRVTAQPGQIEASEVTSVRAKIAGYVKSLAVDIGDAVKKGQVLAELDLPETVAELEQKRALIEQAEADRSQAEAAVRVAEAAVASAEAKVAEVRAGIRRTEAETARWQAEFNRIGQLVRESAVTGTLLDETRSKLSAAQASREEVEAQVKSAEAARAQTQAERDKSRSDVTSAAARVDVAKAEVRRVEAMLGYATIWAPFDGIVTRRNYDAGHLTAPGTGAEPIFEIARSDVVTISLGVPEIDAPYVGPGDAAEVRLQVVEGRTFEGKVARTAWALDAGTRTLRAEIDLPNTDDLLRPGLYAYATVVAEEHSEALTLPTTAVFKEGGKSFCVTVADGRARRREIRTGLSQGKRIEVVSGLDGDEQVVEANAASLVDDQSVQTDPPGAVPKKA